MRGLGRGLGQGLRKVPALALRPKLKARPQPNSDRTMGAKLFWGWIEAPRAGPDPLWASGKSRPWHAGLRIKPDPNPIAT